MIKRLRELLHREPKWVVYHYQPDGKEVEFDRYRRRSDAKTVAEMNTYLEWLHDRRGPREYKVKKID
jgi:hypothetical protein